MRFRLLRRRLTISAPSMAVRSATPWPLRWLLFALVLGISAAVALWAFELGKDLTGMASSNQVELQRLRVEVLQLRAEKDKAVTVMNTSEALITSERAAQEKLTARIQQLESENQTLQDDLRFFEQLIPTNSKESLAIRGLQVENIGSDQLRWQVLLIQTAKNAPAISAKMDINFTGTQAGKPWTAGLTGGPQTVQLSQYKRLTGTMQLPSQTVVKSVSVKVTQGGVVRGVQTLNL